MHAPNTCQVLDSAHSVPKNFDLLLFCKMHSFGEFLICRHARDFRLIPKGEADKKNWERVSAVRVVWRNANAGKGNKIKLSRSFRR